MHKLFAATLITSSLIFTAVPSSIIEPKEVSILSEKATEAMSYLEYLNKLKDELTAKFNDSQARSKQLTIQIDTLTKQLAELNKMANMFSKMLEESNAELTKEMQSKLNK